MNGGAGGVTAAELQQIVPTLSAAKAEAVAPHLNAAMAEANIDTPQRQAMFIAQLAHESGGFHYMEEIASGAAYEGRADLGNTQPGDGERYKGRGYIQVTGRHNYTEAGRALGLDLVNNPELAAQPENAARIAAWYWESRGINTAADAGDFTQVTRLINGGTNGLADRQAYYARASAILD
ncbi:chitinase [Luteimonas sp. FCS-9]|nr:chitinase [Luteimonas sp. FCS-9]